MRDTSGKSDPTNMTTADIKGTIRILEHIAKGEAGPTQQRAVERLAMFRAELLVRS